MNKFLIAMALFSSFALASDSLDAGFAKACYSICSLFQDDPGALSDLARINLNDEGFFIYQVSERDNRTLRSLGQFDEELVKETLLKSARAFLVGQNEEFPAMNLTPLETAAIQQYTSEEYKTINPQLRSGHPSAEVRIYKDYINAALDKLPPYKGIVKRGMRPFTDWDKIYSKDKIVSELAFLSSSTHLEDHKFDNAGITMIIRSKSGRDISKISRTKSEGEVLFKAGTLFFVKDVRLSATPDLGGQTILIEMDEL